MALLPRVPLGAQLDDTRPRVHRRRKHAPRLLTLTLGLAIACQGKPRGHPSLDPVGPDQHTRRDLDLSPEQDRFLTELAAAADERPDDFEARKRSGLAHMSFALAGVLRLRDRAEHDLEAAFALDPSDALVNRSLGRFYNLRAVAGDDSKAEMQVKVYAALLGDQSVEAMDHASFVAYSFFMLAQTIQAADEGHMLRAFGRLRALEQGRKNGDVELRAIADALLDAGAYLPKHPVL